MSIRILIPIALYALALHSNARADSISLPASHDATIFGGVNTTRSSGAGPAMFAGTDGNGSPKRALIAFDLSQIPAHSVITNITLTLYLAQAAGSGGASGDPANRDIDPYNLTSNWGIGTTGSGISQLSGAGQGWPAQTGDATWNFAFYNQTPWTSPGGDFTQTPTAGTAVGTAINAPYTWNSIGMISAGQAWLDSTSPNFGWILKNDDETDARTFRAFWTKEGASANNLPALAPQLVVSYLPPAAQSAVWTATTGGTWQTGTNWSATLPDGIGATATLTTAITTPATITLSAPVTVGSINFSSINAYTITGSTITFQTASAPAQINVIVGHHIINSNLNIASHLLIDLTDATSYLTLSGNITGTAGLSLTGPGTTTLSGLNNYQGNTTVSAGTLAFASAAARPSGDQLSITSNATVTIANDAANIDFYRSQLHSGAITGFPAIAYLTGAQFNSLHGTFLNPTTIILQSTLPGDANMDGQITIDDYLLIDAGYFHSTPAHWVNGDFNYDGTVNDLDYAIIDAEFSAGDNPSAASQFAADAQRFGSFFIAAYDSALGNLTQTTIPEPASCLLLVLGSAGILQKRPRKRQICLYSHPQ